MVDYYYPDKLSVVRKYGDVFGDNPMEEAEILSSVDCNCQPVNESEKSLVTSANYKAYYSSSGSVPIISDDVHVAMSNGTIDGTIKLIERGLSNGRVLWIESNGN